MSVDEENIVQLCMFPTEILLEIFTLLPGRDLGRCRRVSVRWKAIIDGLLDNDKLWHVKCKEDFSKVHEVARAKARNGLTWFNIYKSLANWPRLSTAKEVRHDFERARCINDEIRNFEIQANGIVGVHKRAAIIYYDMETRRRSPRETIPGDYMTYIEDEDTLMISSYHSHLFIVHKVVIDNRKRERHATIDEVKLAILVDDKVFYATLDNDIFVCPLNENLISTFISPCSETIMSIGFANKHLHVLTYERNIFTIENNELIFACHLDDYKNLLNQIHKYNLFEFIDWRIFLQWTCVLGRKVPVGPLQEIITVRTYGEVVFVGCNWGMFYIYYAPYNERGEFDIYNSRPVKQYNFMEHTHPVFTMCPIIQVDVMEAEDGHTVIIALPKKIVSLHYTHDFVELFRKKEVIPNDICRVKGLKIK